MVLISFLKSNEVTNYETDINIASFRYYTSPDIKINIRLVDLKKVELIKSKILDLMKLKMGFEMECQYIFTKYADVKSELFKKANEHAKYNAEALVKFFGKKIGRCCICQARRRFNIV